VRTLIVGGGPAGLTLAIALRQQGLEVHLVESSRDWTVLGTGLSLAGAPLRALKTVGMADRIVRAGFGITTLSIGNVEGEIVTRLERPRLNGPEYPSSLGILRPVLHELLRAEASRAGAQLRLGMTVTSLSQDASGVDVEFSDASSGRYDFVVGADGLHSAVREMMFGRQIPRFTGQAVWRAMLRRPHVVDGSAMYYGPHNKAGLTPVSDDEMYLFLVQNVTSAERHAAASLASALREQLADYRGLVGELREQIVDSARVDYRPLHVLLLAPPWSRGRVVLVGDAVHATTPHLAAGAGLAIEDAVVLAELVSGEPDDVTRALELFAQRRYERCRTIVEASAQLGEWEKRPDDPEADPIGLSKRVWETLAAPI
jgi:2-polyprenyl-6-methoxyphenol hydroxylase-like FAD-dependent oxidoreductase